MNINIPKIKALQIINDLGIRDHVDIINYLEQMCIERGAFVKYADLANGEGRCVIKNGKVKEGIITVVQDSDYPARTRFSIGHELGHFELHGNKRTSFICSQEDFINWNGGDQNLEYEANQFASELLIPSKFIQGDIKREVPTFELVRELSERYQTSLTATAFKIIECTPLIAGLIGYRDGRVLYVKRSKSFEEHGLWIPFGQLDKHTLAARRSSKDCFEKNEVLPEAWLEDCSSIGKNELIEESLFFKNLSFGISIIYLK